MPFWKDTLFNCRLMVRLANCKLNTWDAKTGTLIANGTYGGYWANSGFKSSLWKWNLFLFSAPTGEHMRCLSKQEACFGQVILWICLGEPLGPIKELQARAWSSQESYAHYMYAYNATTGKLVWKQDTSNR